MSDQLQETPSKESSVTPEASAAETATAVDSAPAEAATPATAAEPSESAEAAAESPPEPEAASAAATTEAEPEAKAEPEIKAEPEAKAEPEIKAEPEAKAEPEIKAEPEAAEAKPENKAEAKTEAETEAKTEAKTEAETEAKTEAKPADAGDATGDDAEGDDLPIDPANQTPEMLVLHQAMLDKKPVEGRVIGWNKGGYHVAIDKIAAFCPVSQIEIGNPRSPKRYNDKTFKFQVIEIQKGGRRVVVSRAEALKTERKERAALVKQSLKPKSVHKGKISSLTDFGAFVDLGKGIEGLVHVSEISRRRVEHPKEILKPGQEVEVAVLKVEKGGQRISLSMKRLEEDPWEKLTERLEPGSEFSGKILRKADFGLFVEIEPGLEGLLHNSRLPLGASQEDDAFNVGNTVEGFIHEVEPKRRRLSLSLRPVATGNPWKGIEERYKVDTIVTGKVERLAPFGAFVELEPGLTGLLPFSALGGGGSPHNPRKQYHPGKEVSVRILSIDREKRRISLGTENSQAEGSSVDFREYKKSQTGGGGGGGGMNVMAAALKKAKLVDPQEASDS